MSEITKRSKFYVSSESWTGRPAWAFEISIAALRRDPSGATKLKCQRAPGSNEFEVLAVPKQYFLDNLDKLYVREDRGNISIFLSAEETDLYIDKRVTGDKRGTGGVPFGGFLVTT